MTENAPKMPIDSGANFCALHPERDTALRCNRCERYMCVDCAKRTPVGYTCRQCVRSHENKFFEGTSLDYAIVAAVSLIGGAITAFVTTLLGGILLLGIFIAPALGGAIAQIALQATGRRRGRYSGGICAAGLLAGGFGAGLLLTGLGIFTVIYLALAASAAFARFKASI